MFNGEFHSPYVSITYVDETALDAESIKDKTETTCLSVSHLFQVV